MKTMTAARLRAAFLGLSLSLLGSSTVLAATAAQMNLEEMVRQSDRIFLGTVIDIQERRVAVGGGEVPAVTYRLEVGDVFKGEYEEIKGQQFAEVSMLGTLKNVETGTHPIADFPLLRQGGEYLLIVAPEGPVGLTTTMGLGQGSFSVTGSASSRVALNGAGNVGLFAGMNVGPQTGGALPYAQLAEIIRDIVGGSQ